MMKQFNHRISILTLLVLFSFLTLISCNDSKEKTDDPQLPQVADLTHLPLGGTGATKILIRNQGIKAQPTRRFLSLWLCGLPSRRCR